MDDLGDEVLGGERQKSLPRSVGLVESLQSSAAKDRHDARRVHALLGNRWSARLFGQRFSDQHACMLGGQLYCEPKSHLETENSSLKRNGFGSSKFLQRKGISKNILHESQRFNGQDLSSTRLQADSGGSHNFYIGGMKCHRQ